MPFTLDCLSHDSPPHLLCYWSAAHLFSTPPLSPDLFLMLPPPNHHITSPCGSESCGWVTLFCQVFMSSEITNLCQPAQICQCLAHVLKGMQTEAFFPLPSFIHPPTQIWHSSEALLGFVPFAIQKWFTMNTSALTWQTHAVTRVSAACQEFKATKSVWVQL